MQRLAYLLNFLIVASIGAVFVFLSDIQEDYDLPGWGIGLVASVGFLATLPSTFVASPIADRGYNGHLLAGAVFAAVAGNVLFGFGDTLWEFVLSRGLLGAAIGISQIATRKALIGTDTAGSGRKLGTLISVSVAGFLLGPPLGAQLERFGFATAFVVLGVGTAIVGALVVPWAWSAPVSTSPMTIRRVIGLLSNPAIQGSAIGTGLLFGTIGMFDSTVDIYLEDLGASNAAVGLVLLAVGAPLLVLPRWSGSIMDRREPRQFLVLGLAMTSLTVAGLGAIASVAVFTMFGVLQTAFESFAFPGAQMVTVRQTGAARVASGQALLDASGSLAAGATALIAPIVYENLGARLMFGGYGVILLVGAMVVRNRLRRPLSVDLGVGPEVVVT